jgi:hypothetical protein
MIENTQENATTLAKACSSFGLAVEESARVIKILSKKVHSSPKSTPKIYGQSLRN